MSSKKTAPEAYAAAHTEALALVARIEAALASPQHATADARNWGDVGSVLEMGRALREISDRLFREGEYA